MPDISRARTTVSFPTAEFSRTPAAQQQSPANCRQALFLCLPLSLSPSSPRHLGLCTHPLDLTQNSSAGVPSARGFGRTWRNGNPQPGCAESAIIVIAPGDEEAERDDDGTTTKYVCTHVCIRAYVHTWHAIDVPAAHVVGNLHTDARNYLRTQIGRAHV